MQDFQPKHHFSFTLETFLKWRRNPNETSKVLAQEQLNMHPRRWQKLKLICIADSDMTITIDYGLF